jgi:hypothetical protein
MFSRIIKLLLFLSFIVLFYSCIPLVKLTKIEKPLTEKIKNYVIPDAFKKEYKYICLLNSVKEKVVYKEDKGFIVKYKEHKIYKIINQRKFTYKIYLEDNEKITLLSARTITSDGKKIDLEMDDIFLNEDKYVGIDYNRKSKLVKFNFPKVEIGSTLEIFTETELIENKKPDFYRKQYIQKATPVGFYYYEISMPESLIDSDKFNFTYKIANSKKVKFSKTTKFVEDKKNSTFSWSAQNTVPFKSEKNFKCIDCNKSHVEINIKPWKNWQEMSKILYNFHVNNNLEPGKKIIQKSNELVQNAKTDKEKIQILSNYVQSYHIESYHLDFGYKTRTARPELILRRGYGSSLELAVLLGSMLKAQGFEKIFIALTRDTVAPVFDKNMMVYRYNDALVYMEMNDGEKIWIDPSFYISQLGIISPDSVERPALLLKPEGVPDLVYTPKVGNNYSYDFKIIINIDKDKKTKTSILVETAALTAQSQRYFFSRANKNDLLRYCSRFVSKSYFNGINGFDAKVYNIKHTSINEISNKFKYSFDIDAQILKKSYLKNEYLLDFSPVQIGYSEGLPMIDDNTREFPVIWDALYVSNVVVEINYPVDTLKIAYVPESIDCTVGKDHIVFNTITEKLQPGKLRIKTFYNRSVNKIKPESFDELRKFYRNIAKFFMKKIVFVM